ncbi:hypothetical protein Bhyg_10603 [Pseudolycoriella hygida]|uniref:Uncharacterized protein n=1 Tax=Pseudolycoriella hygida TaxID=35572 RepID=A0A9Q0MWF5_9DIPT|nr:hypothetical protein Bhyg_10603 [Pseudolycoriella hygida]
MTTPDMIHNMNLNQFSAKGFVLWILQDFLRDINMHIWNFHFNASGDIASDAFWENVCLKSAEELENQFPLTTEERLTFLFRVNRAVGSLFDFVWNEQSNFVEWNYACRFLESWQEKTNSFTVKTFTALAGATLLEKFTGVSDWGILSKYINLILSMQKANARQDEAMNVFIYCADKAQIRHLSLLVASTVPSEVRKMSLDILANVLEFSRKNEMSVDCDWTLIFEETLFSFEKEISEKSFKLFIFETERTDSNTPADELTIMEKALNTGHRGTY